MIVNLDYQVRNLDGSTTSGSAKAADLLSDILQHKTDHLGFAKAIALGEKFKRGGDIEIDKPDLELLKKEVETTKLFGNFENLIKDRITDGLNAAVEARPIEAKLPEHAEKKNKK